MSRTEQQAKITASRAGETIEDLKRKLEEQTKVKSRQQQKTQAQAEPRAEPRTEPQAKTQSDRDMWKRNRLLQQSQA